MVLRIAFLFWCWEKSSDSGQPRAWVPGPCRVPSSQLCCCLGQMEQQISCAAAKKKQQNSTQKVPIAARLLMPRTPRRWAKAWVAWVCLDALIAKGPPQGPPAKGCQGPPSRIPRRRLLCSARYARLVPTTPRYQPNTVSFRSRTRASAGRASLQAHPAQCVQRCWSPAVCGSALCWESLQSQCGLRVCVGAWHGRAARRTRRHRRRMLSNETPCRACPAMQSSDFWQPTKLSPPQQSEQSEQSENTHSGPGIFIPSPLIAAG